VGPSPAWAARRGEMDTHSDTGAVTGRKRGQDPPPPLARPPHYGGPERYAVARTAVAGGPGQTLVSRRRCARGDEAMYISFTLALILNLVSFILGMMVALDMTRPQWPNDRR